LFKSKSILLLVLATAIFCVSFLYINVVRPQYLSLYNSDPLDMINVLFPVVDILAVLFVAVCVLCVYYKVSNKFIHIALLVQLAVLLWYTPAYLSNYIYGFDSFSNGGVVPYAPAVLQGYTNSFTSYIHDYPGSFVFNFAAYKTLGVDFATFSRVISPLYWMIAFVLLSYVIIKRLFHDSSIAFISTVLIILGILTLEYFPTPSATGNLLTFTMLLLVLLFPVGKVYKILSLPVVLILIVAHPESPLLLLVFLIAPFVVKILTSTRWRLPFTIFLPITIFVIWLSWASLSGASTFGWSPIISSVQRVLAMRSLSSPGQLVATGQTIYPLYNNIRAVVLYSYGLIAVFFVLLNLKFSKSLVGIFNSFKERFSKEQVLLLVVSALLLVIVVVFGTVVNASIKQRAVLYLVICLSAFIGSGMYGVIKISSRNVHLNKRRNKKLWFSVLVIWVVALGFVYPLGSYYQVPYFSAPQSEGVGMDFMAAHTDFHGQTIATYRPHDLALSIGQESNFSFIWLPQQKDLLPTNLQAMFEENVSIAIFRQSLYWEYSIALDRSFNDNCVTRTLNATATSPFFAETYSSPTFQMYVNQARE
jgi:hypothetical protein